MFKGSITALVSPFNNGKLDIEAYEKHIDFQIQGGSNGIVPCGTQVSRQLYLMMNINY